MSRSEAMVLWNTLFIYLPGNVGTQSTLGLRGWMEASVIVPGQW